MSTILMQLNSVQDYDLWYLICVYINLNIIFIDPFCNWSQHVETTIHLFLHSSNYSNQRKTLFEKISNIKHFVFKQNDTTVVETFLFGFLNDFNDQENAFKTESTIKYIITLKRFKSPLLWIHLRKLLLFLKTLINSLLPYIIFSICLII